MHSDEGKIFVTTHWSLVADAAANDSQLRARALEALCRIYWPPVYAAIRRSGSAPEEARDLTQDFFLSLLTRDFVRSADANRGHFRSYLLGALRHFLSDARDRAGAQKRGGGQVIISIDAADGEESYSWEPVDELSPERIFERRWALTVMARAMSRLEEECSLAGKQRLFSILKPFLTEGAADCSYPAAARQLSQPEPAVRMSVTRLRRRYGELIRAEVTETVSSPEEAEDEMRQLLAILRER